MAGHVRRFNPSHQWVKRRIVKGELKIQQMDVQTYFFRRTNMNAAGKPRSWTDHLLWHHACHTVDLFHFQTGETTSDCYAVQGPRHPQLGIAMDMGILLRTPSGAMCTLSLASRARSIATPTCEAIVDNRSSARLVSLRQAGAATFMIPRGRSPKYRGMLAW